MKKLLSLLLLASSITSFSDELSLNPHNFIKIINSPTYVYFNAPGRVSDKQKLQLDYIASDGEVFMVLNSYIYNNSVNPVYWVKVVSVKDGEASMNNARWLIAKSEGSVVGEFFNLSRTNIAILAGPFQNVENVEAPTDLLLKF